MSLKPKSDVFPLNRVQESDSKQSLILAENSGRLLLARRPPTVGDGVWGMWEDIRQETGYQGKIKFIRKSQMKYSIGRYKFISGLVVVPEEFTPSINQDVQNYQWVMSDQMNNLNLHDNLRIYSKAIQRSLANYYKNFINEVGQGGNVYMSKLRS